MHVPIPASVDAESVFLFDPKNLQMLSLCLAKIKNAFEMNSIIRVRVTCYMAEIQAIAEVWRTTRVGCTNLWIEKDIPHSPFCSPGNKYARMTEVGEQHPAILRGASLDPRSYFGGAQKGEQQRPH